jgi:hypothetical protein
MGVPSRVFHAAAWLDAHYARSVRAGGRSQNSLSFVAPNGFRQGIFLYSPCIRRYIGNIKLEHRLKAIFS